ncbi:hypothetical protein COLO4_15904 [Corchorus olitorius]|uniref:Uncharacterized protein n=1 Tax=Corchorus olitorius TaxID=93759 RepID=A0A1R3JKT6_9ROSI|nr:hypothetical protein COLO4_15904 [Corchorus olitorius]
MSEFDNALTAEDLNPSIQHSAVDDDGNNPGGEEHGSTATTDTATGRGRDLKRVTLDPIIDA